MPAGNDQFHERGGATVRLGPIMRRRLTLTGSTLRVRTMRLSRARTPRRGKRLAAFDQRKSQTHCAYDLSNGGSGGGPSVMEAALILEAHS